MYGKSLSKHGKAIKSIAMLVAVLFLFSEICSFPSQALAQTPHSSTVQGGNNPVSVIGQPQIDMIGRVPPELGTISEAYRATNDQRQATNDLKSRRSIVDSRQSDSSKERFIIYIEDAHNSLEAQENIAKLIHHFVRTAGVRTVFEEGYEGPVPTDEYFGFIKNPALKQKVSYFFLDHLRIGGAEYAHINRKLGVRVEGIAD